MKLLLNEPRGFIGLNGCIVVFIIYNEGGCSCIIFNHEGSVRFIMEALFAV